MKSIVVCEELFSDTYSRLILMGLFIFSFFVFKSLFKEKENDKSKEKAIKTEKYLQMFKEENEEFFFQN